MSQPTNLITKIWQQLKRAETYRNLAKAVWLFFPSVLFLLLTYTAFWKINQGRDLLLFTMEKYAAYIFFILAQLFWGYLIWYSSRLVAKAKYWEAPDFFIDKLRIHLPRFLGFTAYSIIILALLQVNDVLKTTMAHILLLLTPLYYFLIHQVWKYLLDKKGWHLYKVMTITGGLLALIIIAVLITHTPAALIILFSAVQISFVLFVIGRRRVIELKQATATTQQEQKILHYDTANGIKLLLKKMRRLFFDREDRAYFIAFNIISALALLVYVFGLNSVLFSVKMGTVPVVLTAFGLIVGFINLISTASVFARFNFHIVIIVFGFVAGLFKEQYYVQLTKKADTAILFNQRQDLKEYFENWIKQRQDKIAAFNKAGKKYPVFAVLANGGASRSGYWVASVLGQLEDDGGTNFSDHLVCLSGASGGSVGNATYFSLLMNKARVPATGDSSYRSASQQYLQSDFLAHTLTYMLGPDFFRHIIPFFNIANREDALVAAIEKASGEQAFLYKKMDTSFSAFMSRKGHVNYNLPILFVNTTRMQDGRPALVSNIKIDSITFNERVDVLNLLLEPNDMKLSTAVVLGASFPYISPAGRIDARRRNKPKDPKLVSDTIQEHYFVDGGYFDNSGAGAVNEMMIAFKKWVSDSTNTFFYGYKNALDFSVVHILNDPIGGPVLNPVNPLVNDLATPLKTLYGSYGTQTYVNDGRLVNFMKDWYGDGNHYIKVNLYKDGDPGNKYSMNWVISQPVLYAMRQRLQDAETKQKLNTILNRMK
jgi:hypothetical protein